MADRIRFGLGAGTPEEGWSSCDLPVAL